MSSKHLLESEENYKKRQLEEASGTTRGLFETEKDWEECALDSVSNTSRNLFESKKDYEIRRLESLAPDATRRIFESEDDYITRLREEVSGTSRGLFESEKEWKKRSVEENARSIAIDRYEERVERTSSAQGFNEGRSASENDADADGMAFLITIGVVAAIVALIFSAFISAKFLTITVPLVMILIGLIVKNTIAKTVFFVWAVLTFFANIGNL